MSYSLYKQPRSQVWSYDLTVDGHRERKSTRTTDRKLAEEIASRREHELRRAAVYGPDSVLTFAVATDSYLAAGKSDRFIAPVFEHFEKWRVRDITAGDIQEAARKLYPLAGPATRNRQCLSVVQAIINHSALAGLCPPIRVKRFKEPKVVRSAGSKQWLGRFCAHASPELAALATLLFQGGARIGLATALTWDDVNLRDRRIIIPKDKNGDEFRIDLTVELTTMLANLPRTAARCSAMPNAGASTGHGRQPAGMPASNICRRTRLADAASPLQWSSSTASTWSRRQRKETGNRRGWSNATSRRAPTPT